MDINNMLDNEIQMSYYLFLGMNDLRHMTNEERIDKYAEYVRKTLRDN